MAIKSDKWIKDMAENHGMIEPFQYDQVKKNEKRINSIFWNIELWL